MTVPNWTLRALAAVAALAVASRAEAQPGGQKKPPAIIAYPQVGGPSPLPAALFYRPAFDPGPFYNPALNNPYLNQTNFIPDNPVAVNPAVAWTARPIGGCIWGPVPLIQSTPPIAIRQPGQLLYKNPDLQVNPVSGLVYRPLTGLAVAADGSTFYRVPGSGLPTVTGAYAQGTGLYFDPQHNTFLNPATGVISRPGTTNVFIPWRP